MLSHLNEKCLQDLGVRMENSIWVQVLAIKGAWTIQTLPLLWELQSCRSVWVRDHNTTGKYNFTLIRTSYNPLPEANGNQWSEAFTPTGERSLIFSSINTRPPLSWTWNQSVPNWQLNLFKSWILLQVMAFQKHSQPSLPFPQLDKTQSCQPLGGGTAISFSRWCDFWPQPPSWHLLK